MTHHFNIFIVKTAFDNITPGDVFTLLIGLFIFSVAAYFIMKAKR